MTQRQVCDQRSHSNTGDTHLRCIPELTEYLQTALQAEEPPTPSNSPCFFNLQEDLCGVAGLERAQEDGQDTTAPGTGLDESVLSPTRGSIASLCTTHKHPPGPPVLVCSKRLLTLHLLRNTTYQLLTTSSA